MKSSHALVLFLIVAGLPVMASEPNSNKENPQTSAPPSSPYPTWHQEPGPTPGTIHSWQDAFLFPVPKSSQNGSQVIRSGQPPYHPPRVPQIPIPKEEAVFRPAMLTVKKGEPCIAEMRWTTHKVNASAAVSAEAVSSQRQALLLEQGQKLSFKAAGDHQPGTTFQWQCRIGASWYDIAGENKEHYSFPREVVSEDHGSQYRVVARNGKTTTTSEPITVNLPSFLAIRQQPVSVEEIPGHIAVFRVEAEGNPSKLTYQWMKAQSNGKVWVPIPGATSDAYTTTTLSDEGSWYHVKISNGVQTVISSMAYLVADTSVDSNSSRNTLPQTASMSSSGTQQGSISTIIPSVETITGRESQIATGGGIVMPLMSPLSTSPSTLLTIGMTQIATGISSNIQVSLLSMNQGVERCLNSTNTINGIASPNPKEAFKPNVPGVAHRPAHLRAVVHSPLGIVKSVAKNLQAKLTLVDGAGAETNAQTVQVSTDFVWFGWFITNRYDFAFQADYDENATIASRGIRIVLDPSRHVMPSGDPLANTTQNFNPNWVDSQPMTVNLFLVKYIMNNGATIKELSPAELQTQRDLLENRIQAMYPVSYTQLHVNAYPGVEVVWDERGKGTTGADPKTWNELPGSMVDHQEVTKDGSGTIIQSNIPCFTKLATGVQDAAVNNHLAPVITTGADPVNSGSPKMPPNQYYLAIVPLVDGHTNPTDGTHGTTVGFSPLGSHLNWHFSAVHPDKTEWVVHELGHQLGANHTPSVGTDIDPQFPYSGDAIGVFGFDHFAPSQDLSKTVKDIMTYGSSIKWISDYNFWVWWQHQNSNAYNAPYRH